MIPSIGLCIVGLAVLILGAELLTRGAATLARQLGIAPITVGLTIVALGTSTPELAVGIDATLRGQGTLAVGNIAGTNIVNILLILGLSALIRPLALGSQTIRVDMPAMVVAALLMLGLAADGILSRTDGIVLLVAGVAFTAMIVRAARLESRKLQAEFSREYPRAGNGQGLTTLLSGLQLGAGIALVVIAADWFVIGAVGLAQIWGVSDAFIGLTIVAIGTSAPELVTTILSTIKGDRDVAIGNLLGSSVYNICVILGLTCVVPIGGLPVSPELLWVDIPIMALVAVACVPVFRSGRAVSRLEGAALVTAYIGYLLVLLFLRA